ncbi:MAG: CHAT domain-containing protein [Deltaproteobacteria bacterium]|nr:CHAT domain-containing protein [Deltaproteobacteria bacterium]
MKGMFLFSINRFIPFILLIFLIPSCATKMTLEEAKQVTVSVSPVSGFVPPPRRIADITEMLNQPGQFDVRITERLKIQADAVAPEKAGSDFYNRRGWAAMQLGRGTQAIEDMREAHRLMEASGIPNSQILRLLAHMERNFGNFGRAVELIEEAARIDDQPSTYGRLVETYLQMGDLEKAERIANNGKTFCATSPRQRFFKFVTWCNIETVGMEADILEARAQFAEAERSIRRLLELVQIIKSEFPGKVIDTRLRLAKNLARQERFTEAEIEARQALKESLGHGGKDSILTTKTTAVLANILRAQGRLSEAKQLAALAVRTLESSGIPADSAAMSTCRMLLGSIHVAGGEFEAAMTQYGLALKGVHEDAYTYKRRFTANPDFTLSLLMTGHREKALKTVNNTYAKALQRLGEENYITVEKLALRGMAHHRMKHLREAEKDLSAAAMKLIELRTERGDFSRAQRLKIILDDYTDLLGEIHGTELEKERGINAAETAFRITEASRGRTVQAALSASSARAAETNPELNDLIRREQDALKQIEVLESTVLDLIAAPPHGQRPEIIKELRARIMSLNDACAALQEEIRKRFPKYADFTNPKAVSWRAAQENLRPGETLVSVYSTDSKTYVWAIPDRGGLSFYISPYGRKQLGLITAGLRKSLDSGPVTLGDIPEFNTGMSLDLYRALLKPVENAWKDSTDLLAVIHDPLDQIPLSVLVTDTVETGDDGGLLFGRYRHIPWLVKKVSITVLPSVSSLVILRALPAGDPGRRTFAGFGDPVFNAEQLDRKSDRELPRDTISLAQRGTPLHVRGVRVTEKGTLDNDNIITVQLGTLNRLPDTAEEIRSIATAVEADPARDVFLGKDASESRVKTMTLSDRKVISFATHALVPGDLDGLDQPALALSSPTVTEDNEDGLLTMGEIMKLKLNADWVVLSACNTAAAEGSGSEALSGVGRAFFYAGTRAILASMYPVETTSARKLITALFRYQKEDPSLSRARALRKSMLNLMDRESLVDESTGKVAASYAHPLFWAPFILVGDGS